MTPIQRRVKQTMLEAANWLAYTARVRTNGDVYEDPRRYPTSGYLGAVRNEYDSKSRKWMLNGPVWHTGQAVRALAIAHRYAIDESLFQVCREMGNYIVRNIVDEPSSPNHGLLLAYEGDNVAVNNQTVLETVPGLLDLAQVTGERTWVERAQQIVDFLLDGGYIADEGLIIDHYHVGESRFMGDPDNELPGRPLIDDAALHQLATATDDSRYTEIFLAMADRAVRTEDPAGTWIVYPPWNKDSNRMHIRTSWWWGYPLLLAYDLAQDKRFWEAALRVGDWYLQQQNLDGGFYYSPMITNKHTSFGLATSGSAVATIIWADLFARTGERKYQEAVNRSIRYLMAAQFSSQVDDPNIRGALWESPNLPDGSGAPGFYIRDIASIFAIRAIDKVLSVPDLLETEGYQTWDNSMPW